MTNIISKPDKSSGVVIINGPDYVKKMAHILNNTSKCTQFRSVDKFDQIPIQEQCIQR